MPLSAGTMTSGKSRGMSHSSLKHISIVRGMELQPDDEPNTPSKSKMMPRRPLGLYAILVLFGLSIAFFVSRGDPEPMRTSGSYYGKVSAANLYASGGKSLVSEFEAPGELGRRVGQRGAAAEGGEARQREALEIADRILHNQHAATSPPGAAGQAHLGELVAGGGSVAGGGLAAPGQAAAPDPAAKDANGLPGSSRKATATVKQVFSNGETREIVVDAARVAFLDVMSDGLDSQELGDIGPDHTGWWSDRVAPDGRRAAPVQRPEQRSTAALATVQALSARAEGGAGGADDGACKIAVLDVAADMARTINARQCELKFKRVWPFSRHKFGIDGVQTLAPEHYQYSQEHWISQAIRNSSRFTASIEDADFVFVDMWCYHVEWLAYIHPLGNRNTTNPEPYVRRALNAIVKMDRFLASKGGDFGMVHPNPVMRGLFSEEAMCEDLASVYSMVPERSSLCVWTPDSPAQGKSAIVPYLATLDLDLDADLEGAARDLFLFFRGGCGHPDPSIRSLFAAGKMMRYELVAALDAMGDEDVHAECSCDICDNHMPHEAVQESYRRAVFCPVLPSNVQSSRRLSEVVLAGCIPVFMGPPFHTLPLAQFVDYAAMGVFLNVSAASWVNESSPNYLQNHMAGKVWRLDDPRVEEAVVSVDSLEAAVRHLRGMAPEEVAAKRKAVLAERWKFYYGPVPESQGGDGRTSALGELLMQQMCKRAAASKRRLNQAVAQGMDIQDSDVQIHQASVVGSGAGAGGSGGSKWSIFGRSKAPAGTAP